MSGSDASIAYACTAAFGFGIALVFTKLGLRYLTARAGAAVSIPSTTLWFWCAAPFALDLSGWNAQALAIFAIVGAFFPAAVTLLVFEANDRLGPTIAGTLSSTTPLFAVAGAIIFLGETLSLPIAAGAIAVVGGIAAMMWRPSDAKREWSRTAIALPLLAAAIRGLSQAIVKVGLNLWPNPFAAALTGYSMSTATVLAVDRFDRERRKSENYLKGTAWFVLAGLANGGAVLAMYYALKDGRVTVVSTIVAAHPFVALVIGALVLRLEKLDALKAFGVMAALGGVVLVILG